MSRGLTAPNIAEVDANYFEEVLLVKMEFDEPAYAHSGYGIITFDGNDYIGVGQFGSISDARESEVPGPLPLTLTLSGVDAGLLAEALDSGSYGDVVTIYIGYRQDDGTLVDNPWIAWKGAFEFASISQGAKSAISVTLQHDLAVLDEIPGDKFSDEDQQSKFSGDLFFEYQHEMATVKLNWGNAITFGANIDGRSKLPGYYT